MSTYYWTCPHCGANLDPGEKCDCPVAKGLVGTDYRDVDQPENEIMEENEHGNPETRRPSAGPRKGSTIRMHD